MTKKRCKNKHLSSSDHTHSSSINSFPIFLSKSQSILSANPIPGVTTYIIAWTQLHTIDSSCRASGPTQQKAAMTVNETKDDTHRAWCQAAWIANKHYIVWSKSKTQARENTALERKEQEKSVPTYLMLCLTAECLPEKEKHMKSINNLNLCNRKWASREVLKVSEFEKLGIFVVQILSPLLNTCCKIQLSNSASRLHNH